MAVSRRAASAAGSPPDTGALLRKLLAATLRKSPSFAEIPASARLALEREFQIRTYAPRDIIFFEGQVHDEVLLPLRGVVTLTYLDSRHRRVLFAVVGPGDVCCHSGTMPDALRTRLRMDAVRDCVIASLDYKRLVELLFGIPFGRFAAGTSFVFGPRDFCLARDLMARGKTLRERLVEVVADLCARFGVSEGRGAIIDLPLTHEDLADLVGATRPKVTHEVRLLEKEGVIARHGRRLVVKKVETLTS
jgi:CRP-like cAMP-binding protein